MKFGIGQAPTRVEDSRLLSGGGRYTDDAAPEGAAWGYVLRSPVAHADITEIDADAARAAPGVLAVLTRDEIAADGVGGIPCLSEVKNHDDSDHPRPPWPILATDRVRYVGAPVAFVVAETLEAAKDAAELIEVDYAELPVETGTFAATEPGAPQIWAEAPGNIALDYRRGDAAAAEAAFAGAAEVARIRIVNNRIISNPMEPRAASAKVDGSGRITMRMPSQGPFFAMQQLCGMLKIAPEELRIITGDVGGGFGTRAFLYPEPALTLWAAKRLGRSVRWTGERQEIFLSDAHGRDNVTEAELAMDGEGRFLALRATTYAAMGAHLSNFGPLIPTDAAVGMYTGLYRIPVCAVTVKGVYTNTVPVDAYRGAGRPEAAYMVERLVDAAARQIGMAPDALRRLNFPGADEMPHEMGLGDMIDSGDFSGLMDRALEAADWGGFDTRRTASEAAGKRRGRGFSTYIEKCGGGGMTPAKLVFGEDDRLAILSGTQDSGQGHAVSFRQIASEKLGIDADLIDLIQGDTDRAPPGFTGGSKSIAVGGTSILFASDKVIAKGKELAGHLMEVAAADIVYDDGAFAVAGTDKRIELFELARIARDPTRLPEGMEPGLDAEHDHTAEAATFPNGCHVCEVEVDPETGQIALQSYQVVDDFGVTLNPMLLEGQVHGGIAQGLGQAWAEHTVYDEGGQLLSGSFMDYQMPRAADFPSIAFETRNTRCQANPLGVKGAGEAGAIGAPPAFVNAVVDALISAGAAPEIDMPLTPEKVWRAIRTAT